MRSTAFFTVLSAFFLIGASAAPVQVRDDACAMCGRGGTLSLLSGNDIRKSITTLIPQRTQSTGPVA